MKNLVMMLLAVTTLLPQQALAQRYFARIKLQPTEFSGSWTTQTSSPYCSGPERRVDVTQVCTGGACDPNRMAASTTNVVGSCTATCQNIVEGRGWLTPFGQSYAGHDLASTPSTTGWQDRAKAICAADPLPHVGCHVYGKTTTKFILAKEGGGPSDLGLATDSAITCTWK